MKISAATRISALLKANPASIEAIVSINKHFEKLRNPILRKVLAPRVTIADAAKIGHCTVEDFFEKLKPLGFEVEITDAFEKKSEAVITIPDFVRFADTAHTTTLDVRNEISNGRDPFQIIMNAVETLPAGNILLLINSFEPVPLINILTKKGFNHFTDTKPDGIVNTFFKKEKPDSILKNELPVATSESGFNEISNRFKGNFKTIDVRHLEMPLPMVTILRELEILPGNMALFVHHKKVPQFLLPELQERNFNWAIDEKSGGEVDLIIYRK